MTDSPSIHASPAVPRPGYKLTKLGWIPEEWEVKRLDQVAEIQTGIQKGAKKTGKTIQLPYLRVANVQDGYLDLREIKTIDVPAEKAERYSLQVGDVLMTEGGDFDKLGRGTIWKGEIPKCVHQNHIFAVRPDPNQVLPYYLASYSGSPRGKQYFIASSKQSTNLASINSTQLKAFPLPLPPLAEQRKIAAILSTWDRAIGQTEALLAQLRQRNRGLAQQLLTGERRVAGFEGAWKEVRLGEVFSERKETGFEGLPLVSITGDRGVIWRDELDKKDSSSEDKSKYLRICPGDIGYNTMRMWQGRSAVSDREGIVSPAYTVLTPTDRVDADFMGRLFQHPRMIHNFFRYSQGLVNDTLNCKYPHFAKVQTRIPPLPEQQAIARILQAADAEVAAQEARLTALREQKRGLMQGLLTGAVRVGVELISSLL
ncbi:MAG: restriction endonuclease subunit S [Bacteroidia bacterium]|nr:restriction endonuclease subunit S [Bacteroidia bacterium]